MADKPLERTAFTTSRDLEFFSEKELIMQIGHPPHAWPVALLKELIDNALDACEDAGTPPAVRVKVEPDAFTVSDNGPGLPPDILTRSLDYGVRVSDKANYVSPTRGQLGNALKCVWAAPFVASGERGQVEVVTRGEKHVIEVALDRVAQRPDLLHSREPAGEVKTGTSVRVCWPEVASYLDGKDGHAFYDVFTLIRAYFTFNPHAGLDLELADAEQALPATCPGWEKWPPSRPTSPHWYTAERLRALIAAYVTEERAAGKALSVREFVAEFHGLSGTRKQKAVAEAACLPGAWLSDLVADNDVDAGAVARLLGAMKRAARAVKPKALGVIGERHLADSLWVAWGGDPESVRYKRTNGEAAGVPFVLEVAFGVREAGDEGGREVVTGLNWSPVLGCPIDELAYLLGEARVDEGDPVTVIVHLACPRLDFTDRGKGQLDLPHEIVDALGRCLRSVTRQWKDAKRQADREGRLQEQQLERLRKARRRRHVTLREAAYEVMERAYMHASTNNTLPANARQIMYAARPHVMALTGGKCWTKSSYFTQRLLRDFVNDHPELTETWDIVFDARGRLVEPHTARRIDLGTLAVRQYIGGWVSEAPGQPARLTVPHACPTVGPANRYRFALFIEKEGFAPLLERAGIANRFDVAIMSTKGMSVAAARQLVDRLSQQGVTVLVLHDFDKSGFSIVHTLRSNSGCYRFESPPRVIDLGLRIGDVAGLQSEPVEYRSKKNPRDNLRESGATEEECDFLVRWQTGASWAGERVELNAMTSTQFIEFLERKLTEVGAAKLVPSDDDLRSAWRRAWGLVQVQEAMDAAVQRLCDASGASQPPDLPAQVLARIKGTGKSWDEALWEIAREKRRADEPGTAAG
jgi:DNA topoisomerase VI subunit B